MAWTDWLVEIPIIGDLFDASEAVGGLALFNYSDLRDAMEWTEVGNTGLDTRNYMLAEQSLAPVTWNEAGNEVVSGKWEDINGYISTDPEDFDIDHRVAFSQIVKQCPAIYDLPFEQQLEIFNDRDNLQILHDVENREKSNIAAVDYATRILDAVAREQFVADASNYWASLKDKFKV